MITKDRDLDSGHRAATLLPVGLPAAATLACKTLSSGEVFEILLVPITAEHEAEGVGDPGATLEAMGAVVIGWVAAGPDAGSAGSAPAVTIPLYGTLVAWGAGRAAVVGPAERLADLERTVLEFAGHEAALRDAERRAAALLAEVEADLDGDLGLDDRAAERRAVRGVRHREAVAVARSLAFLAPAIHAAPLHPPTLSSQLGERLRDRSRLADRHELAMGQAELAERVAEGASQRALDIEIARRQMGLEWAIIVLLMAQTAILVVDLLAQQGTP